MKKIIVFLFTVFAFSILSFSADAVSSSDISIGISIIREKTKLTKNANTKSKLGFEKKDFDEIFLEEKYDFIKITSVPEKTKGIIRFNGIEVNIGQSISKNELEKLDFVFMGDSESAIFTFSNSEKDTSYECCIVKKESIGNETVLNCLDENYEMYKNTAISGILNENSENTFIEIISAPKNGVIEIKSPKSGEFVYRPKTDFTGKDTFSYRICNEYGEKSNISNVKISVEKAQNNLYFADMKDNTYQTFAIKASELKLIPYELSESGLPIFLPDSKICKNDFYEAISVIDSGEIEVNAVEDKVCITVLELKQLVTEYINEHPDIIKNISKEEIDKILNDLGEDSKEVKRQDFAKVLCKIMTHFS